MIESEWIASEELRSRIKAAENDDLASLALRLHASGDEQASFLLLQAAARKTAKTKMPLWYANDRILYPDYEAIEQCSSDDTAAYKAENFKTSSLADLCGGLGVDTAAFSATGAEILFNEPNERRLAFAKHNFDILQRKPISYFNTTAEVFVAERHFEHCELVYLDPSRRDMKKRLINPEDYQPRLNEIVPELLSCKKKVLIKTSPMLDIQAGLRYIEACSEVHVVGRQDECRELLFFCEPGFEGEPKIVSFESGETSKRFTFMRSEESQSELRLSEPLRYIMDPFSVILKAGAFRSLMNRWPDLFKLHSQTHLYTSNALPLNFPGKAYEVEAVLPYKKEVLIDYLAGERAVSLFRNFPEPPDKVMKKLKIASGTRRFLFFCTLSDNKPAVVLTRRL